MGDRSSQLRVAFHRLQDWAYPDEIDHELFRAFMKTPHDVGGEPNGLALT
jgi:thiocyanate hydrolase subunit alpha/thiocyanate hydrolase subunit beta